jgi:phosphoesterase RecJ-like protein
LNTIYQQIKELVDSAQTVLILQPDNPDGDSMGSALGLEEILGDLGKQPLMFSYKPSETYLRLNEGWDRVSQAFPKSFDLTILVDTASPTLLVNTLEKHGAELSKRPAIVIDHHNSRSEMGFITHELIQPTSASTGEQIIQLAEALNWPINQQAATKLAAAIISDSLNLTVPMTSYETVAALASCVKAGANLSEMNTKKREANALTPELQTLKAKLLTGVEYAFDGRLAIASIDAETMSTYKDQHDPCDLIIWDMQWVKGVEVAAVFKHYGTKIKVSMRAKRPIAAKLAEAFDGGGHDRAAAFKAQTTDMQEAIQSFKAAFEVIGAPETQSEELSS